MAEERLERGAAEGATSKREPTRTLGPKYRGIGYPMPYKLHAVGLILIRGQKKILRVEGRDQEQS